ncbi:MAG TPA: lipid-binding SYLF domain-containing protein [Verrucomicrobiae bacterium]|jgi:lipid-binding SYLF domain-containing protein|nr:lipid-binding SYLF domain-containing protein [Verrucomicrobiae bacterium]
MKRLGILIGLLVLSAGMVIAQDNTSSSSSSTTTTTSNDQSQSPDQSQNDARKQAAQNDANAADSEKQAAKDAGTKTGEEHDKAVARLDDASKDLNELLAAPDNGIPDSVFTKAKCVAVVPSLVKGGFIFGAEHGRGVASCRLPNGGWSAPAFFTMTGGSWGAQIGAEGVDLIMLIMNDNGMNQLLSAKFKLGGSASASAGPVGRQAAADTSWKMDSEILTYSRSRGLFAGATLNGTAIHDDENAMLGYYGRNVGFRPVLTGQVKDTGNADTFLSTLRRNRAEVNAQAH